MPIGIIVEYNPFHNGHQHHINEVKKMFPNETIIAVMSPNFVQRGEVSIIDKWTRAEMALLSGVDLVLELPTIYAISHADLFAKGALQILNDVGITDLVFGSEQNDINLIIMSARIQLYEASYNQRVRDYLTQGLNYPTAMSKALSDLIGHHYDTPNDLLGLSYVKEIIAKNYEITPHTIKRTNDYHEEESMNEIASATAIRQAIKNKKEMTFQVPGHTLDLLMNKTHVFKEAYFPYIKYQIMSKTKQELSEVHGIDEGFESRLKKYINEAADYESFMNLIKTKRYTYNRIQRILINILLEIKKETVQELFHMEYIRILGFTKTGRSYLKTLKGKTSLPLLSRFVEGSHQLDFEMRATQIYTLAMNDEASIELIRKETSSIPLAL